MTNPTRARAALSLVLLMLVGSLLACTLSWGEDEDQDATPDDSGGGGSGGVPTVHILSPQSGQQVPVNQRVDITVETNSTATSFVLNVGGRVAGTKAMPPGQSGPTQAILSWQPDREGTFSLEVVGFNGASAGLPAALLLEVSGTASGSPDGDTGVCSGRVLVSQLNYRAGPGTGATKLGQFDVGETVTVIGRNGDTSWYKVQRTNAQQVWAVNNTQWLQVEGACSSLPLAD
ncbi:MAG: SH3 domain-containing protein [Anaerolineae bacterium]|jgi:hypothetical protein|nr:SH3 domain-containing protein [Anaerolineae bacterium]